jgi:hypothetical protein
MRCAKDILHASVTATRRTEQQNTIVAARSPIVAKNDFYPTPRINVGETRADAADISGAALAERTMEP